MYQVIFKIFLFFIMVISGGGGKGYTIRVRRKDRKQETNDHNVFESSYETIFSSTNSALFNNVITLNHTHTNLHSAPDKVRIQIQNMWNFYKN